MIRRVNEYARRVTADLRADGNGWILLTVSLAWTLSVGVRYVYPALVPYFQSDFGIGLGTTGLLLSMLWASYALGHIPGGILGDVIGEGNLLVLSTLVSAAAVFVLLTAVSVWMLFAGVIGYGLATALFGPTRFTILTDLYDERAGSAIGLTMAAGSLGQTVYPIGAALIASYTTWRYGLGVFGPLFVVAAFGLWLAVPSRTSTTSGALGNFSMDLFRKIRSGISRESIPVIVGVQITVSFVNQGFSSFFPTYLVVTKGFTPSVAAGVFGFYFAAGMAIQPLTGTINDAYSTRTAMIVAFATCVTALWILPFIQGLIPIIILAMLVRAVAGVPVASQTYIASVLPEDMQGTGLGMVKAGWMVLGATAPLFIGVLADSGMFDEGFLFLAGVGTFGLLVTITRL